MKQRARRLAITVPQSAAFERCFIFRGGAKIEGKPTIHISRSKIVEMIIYPLMWCLKMLSSSGGFPLDSHIVDVVFGFLKDCISQE